MPRSILTLTITFALGPLVTPLAADVQPAVKVPRIGILSPASGPSTPVFEAFRQGLRKLGASTDRVNVVDSPSDASRSLG